MRLAKVRVTGPVCDPECLTVRGDAAGTPNGIRQPCVNLGGDKFHPGGTGNVGHAHNLFDRE
jgi:hypothetical protein